MSSKSLKPVTDLDSNVWWHLSETRVDNYTKPTFGAMLQVADNGGIFVYGTGANQYWQFQPLDKPGRYALRNSKTQMNKQLSVCYNPEEIDEHRTRACMAEPSGADEQKWDVFDNGNETLGFISVKNGTSFHLDVRPGSNVYMSSNINSNAYQPAQHWILTTSSQVPVSTIVADGTTRTVSRPSRTAFPFHSGSGSSSDDPDNSPSSGVSSGAAAGIGIGAGLVVIALFFAACYLWRRRRRRSTPDAPVSDPSAPGTNCGGATAYASLEKPSPVSPYSYHAHGSSPAQYPPIAGGGAPQEMPYAPAPGELPADTHYNELEGASAPHAALPHPR
ncbi:ricin-type beta-trefoil lectin domain-like domain-containing protein [Hirsutella rhossiliensis]|uniref:Ricin-type beta-trefoil lectin domain-like domain-containing protein n=1 Tax=Hirsutella rhossiliensis TaxID=111463 RepID=A0A9P8SK48_9HYPO|nr:ricin-type beta-trefoil lectin domain-like domain-containing protein [Hirsutella rhossiliensis]KAH0965973.1 ricin-type beta-trefoil lectin domain-like domain-containing protein [Hirsutella rhossiliensis]